MKIFVYLVAAVQLSCASLTVSTNDISLDIASNLKPDIVTSSEIEKRFGTASVIENTDLGEVWTYREKVTGNQRLALTFSPADKKLKSVLWTPRPGERENNLSYILSKFPDLKRSFVNDDEVNSHAPDQAYVNYRDDINGQSILVLEPNSRVEGVAWFSLQEREITNVPIKKKVKYKL
jgi:hypothetical protein